MLRVLLAAVVLLALAACGAADDEPGSGASPAPTLTPPPSTPGPPSPTTSRTREPSEPAPSYSTWELGARELPLRPDGLGEMGQTPPSLRERRYPTTDLLPKPQGEAFASTIGPVTPDLRRRMGATWAPGCPVALDALRYLTVSFRGFDGADHTGELVVAADEAEGVVSVFRALHAAAFPIEEMRLPTTTDLEAPPTGDGNNTAAYVCRATTGGTTYSAHAYGLAIDVNPFINPYLRDDVVLPELARSYLDREWRRPGMIVADSLVLREFARIGWSWGGAWSSLKDYQHFSATGR